MATIRADALSPLTQIDVSNVGRLTKVWEADMAPTAPGPVNGLEVTPIMVGDTLYACDGHNGIHASMPKPAENAGGAISPMAYRRLANLAAASPTTRCRAQAGLAPNASSRQAKTRRWSRWMQEPVRSALASETTARWT